MLLVGVGSDMARCEYEGVGYNFANELFAIALIFFGKNKNSKSTVRIRFECGVFS